MKSDIQIAQNSHALDITEISKKVGLTESDLELYGHDKAKINWTAINRNKKNGHLGKLILVTS